MSISVGLGSGSRSAKIATANTRTIQPAATQNSKPSRRPRGTRSAAASSSLRSSSSVAMTNPRVEHGVEQIDDEIDEDVSGSNEQDDALQDDQIARVDRADQQPAQSRQGKD